MKIQTSRRTDNSRPAVCWSDLPADTGTLFFQDKIQTHHSQTQLHKEESLFFVKKG